ncbi:Coiled-coil domain-containing protein [Schistosoma japonicum]|nr:Coiled-coil domain-containing protein [Schistosoma japonicum]
MSFFISATPICSHFCYAKGNILADDTEENISDSISVAIRIPCDGSVILFCQRELLVYKTFYENCACPRGEKFGIMKTKEFSKIHEYDEYIDVENLPISIIPYESDYQLVLPPLTSDKCIVSQKYDSSNILQRLTLRRKEKHRNRLKQWHEKLSEISQDIEKQVKLCCENTADLLKTSWEKQNSLLNTNLLDEQLLKLELDNLNNKWNQIDYEYVQRRNEINNLHSQLFTLENKRVHQIKQEFHELTDYLSRYSHLPPYELQSTIDIELLENRRELANLIKNLHLTELMHHRYTNLVWSEYQNHWQKLNIDELLHNFSEHLNPLNNMEEFLEKWNDKVKQLFKEWENCIPLLGELQHQFENNLNYLDHCFSRCLSIWSNELIQPLLHFSQMFIKLWKFYNQLPMNNFNEELNTTLINIKQVVYEEIKKKDELINASIDALRQSSTEQIINEKLQETMNLLNEISVMYKTLNDKQVECIDTYAKQMTNHMDTFETVICRFFGVVHCTKQQAISLEKRLKHQTSPTNQIIKLGFEQFIYIQRFNDVIELDNLTTTATTTTTTTTTMMMTTTTTSTAPTTNKQLISSEKINPNNTHIFYHIKSIDNAIDDLVKFLQTDMKSNSTLNTFNEYLMKNIKWSGIFTGNEISSSNEFMSNTQIQLVTKATTSLHNVNNDVKQFVINNEMEPITVNNYITDYIKPIQIEKCLKIIKNVKMIIRGKILEYLEQWKGRTMMSTKEEIILRKTEVNNEYQLQMKLHEPRTHRVKEDVANVRLTELALHQTRIERHIASVNLILNDMKLNSIQILIDNLNKSEEQMNKQIQCSIDSTMNKATKSSKLLLLRKRVENYAETHIDYVRQSLKSFRSDVENQLQIVNNANLKLINSLELFIDGGNFSMIEVKKYTNNLNQLTRSIQQFEEETIGMIESIEKERQLSIDNKMKQFETILKPHLADVQIKVQTEDSSSQSKVLLQQIEQFQCLLKSLTDTNQIVSNALFNKLSSNQSTIQQFNMNEKKLQKELINKVIDLLITVCVNASDRCIFLNCLRSQLLNYDNDDNEMINEQNERIRNNKVSKLEVTNNMKKQFTLRNHNTMKTELIKYTMNQSLLDNFNSQNAIQISRPGRLFTDDACTQIVQSILNESTVSDENTTEKLKTITPNQLNENTIKHDLFNSNNKQSILDDNQKLETKVVNTPTKSHRSRRDVNNTTLTSGIVQKTNRRKKNLTHSTTNKTIVKHNRPQVYYDVFGKDLSTVEHDNTIMKQVNIEHVTYIGRIQKICRECLHNALHLSESYYRQKGLRQSTRPEFIKSTFDDAANTIISNLKRQFNEAEIYRNLCIRASQLPSLLYEEMLNEIKLHILQEMSTQQNIIQIELNKLNELRIKYNEQLHFNLCSMNQQIELMNLIKQENLHKSIMNNNDHMITEDIDRGKHTWNGVKFSELIKTNQINTSIINMNQSNENQLKQQTIKLDHFNDNDDDNNNKRKKHSLVKQQNVTIISNNQLPILHEIDQDDYCLVSAKTTEAHLSTLKYRDVTVEEFRIFTQNLLECIENEYTSAIKDNELRKNEWIESVNLLIKL